RNEREGCNGRCPLRGNALIRLLLFVCVHQPESCASPSLLPLSSLLHSFVVVLCLLVCCCLSVVAAIVALLLFLLFACCLSFVVLVSCFLCSCSCSCSSCSCSC